MIVLYTPWIIVNDFRTLMLQNIFNLLISVSKTNRKVKLSNNIAQLSLVNCPVLWTRPWRIRVCAVWLAKIFEWSIVLNYINGLQNARFKTPAVQQQRSFDLVREISNSERKLLRDFNLIFEFELFNRILWK